MRTPIQKTGIVFVFLGFLMVIINAVDYIGSRENVPVIISILGVMFLIIGYLFSRERKR